MRILARDLVRLVDETHFAASTHAESAPQLRGLYLEPVLNRVRLVGTNGAVLAWASAPVDYAYAGCTVPPLRTLGARVIEVRGLRWAAARLVGRGGSVTLDYLERGASQAQRPGLGVTPALRLSWGDHVVEVPTIDAPFPDYAQVDTPGPYRVQVRRDSLLAAVQRLEPLAVDVNRAGTIVIAEDVQVEVAARALGQEPVALSVPLLNGPGGRELITRCNLRTLAALLPYAGEVVEIGYNGPLDCLFLLGRTDWRGVIATLRVA